MDDRKKIDDAIKERQVTYEIYAAMPDDGVRYEVIDGSLEAMFPSPSTTHQAVIRELGFIILQSCKSDYIIYYAPLDVILSEKNVLQPDIVMIHRSRSHIVADRGIEGPPDLVVEIVSPSSRKRDKVVKAKKYAEYGVEEYWIVDAETRTLEQYRLEGSVYEIVNLFEGDDVVNSDKLPCVSFAVSDIFRELPN